MPRKFLKQTADVIARETALVVYFILAVLVAIDISNKLDEIARSSSQTAGNIPNTICYEQGSELPACNFDADKP